MHPVTIVLLVILVILIGLLVGLYFFGKKTQKKQEEQQAQIEAQLSAPTSSPVHADPKNGAKKDVKPTATAEYAENFWNMIRNRGHYGEVRNALSVGEDTEGGFTVPDEFEKKLVAYHEVGHAMVAYKQKNSEPVQKITIVPHTQGALGYTLLMPEEDKTELRTREELLAKINASVAAAQ